MVHDAPRTHGRKLVRVVIPHVGGDVPSLDECQHDAIRVAMQLNADGVPFKGFTFIIARMYSGSARNASGRIS